MGRQGDTEEWCQESYFLGVRVEGRGRHPEEEWGRQKGEGRRGRKEIKGIGKGKKGRREGVLGII